MRCNGLILAEDLMGQLDMKAALRLVDDPDPKVRLHGPFSRRRRGSR